VSLLRSTPALPNFHFEHFIGLSLVIYMGREIEMARTLTI
jgi:hypothetical protein